MNGHFIVIQRLTRKAGRIVSTCFLPKNAYNILVNNMLHNDCIVVAGYLTATANV